MADYNKVGLFTLQGDRFLLCRKNHSTSKLILPGGCIEPGESHEECLRREIQEELGAVTATRLQFLGCYLDRAANDDPRIVKTVEIHLYQGELAGTPKASSEIIELVWFGADSDRDQLSSILLHKILPDLLERKRLPWI